MKKLNLLLILTVFISLNSCGVVDSLFGKDVRNDNIFIPDMFLPEDIATDITPDEKTAARQEELDTFVDKYKKEYKETLGISLETNINLGFPVKFSEILDDEILGYCVTYTDGSREVLIDVTFWDQLDGTDSDNIKETIIRHELGHCHLNRKHFSGEISIGLGPQRVLKESIMTPTLNRSIVDDFYEFENGYVYELFKGPPALIEDSLLVSEILVKYPDREITYQSIEED